eukprot:4531281-Prymnesium_polylepis.2
MAERRQYTRLLQRRCQGGNASVVNGVPGEPKFAQIGRTACTEQRRDHDAVGIAEALVAEPQLLDFAPWAQLRQLDASSLEAQCVQRLDGDCLLCELLNTNGVEPTSITPSEEECLQHSHRAERGDHMRQRRSIYHVVAQVQMRQRGRQLQPVE